MILAAALVALLFAGVAAAQADRRPNPLDPQAKVRPVEYRSALADYQPFVERKTRDWRGANEEVGAAGGHSGQRPDQRPREQALKPQPGKPAHDGHGADK